MNHSALYQMEGVGNVFSKHHIFKCSSAPRSPLVVLCNQSQTKLPDRF